MDIKLELVKVGPERTNCYVLTNKDGESVIVDPGADPEAILLLLHKSKKLKYILLTHGHYDHVGAVDDIKRLYPETPVMISENDIALYSEVPEQGLFVGELLPQPKSELRAIQDGEILPFGNAEIKTIATPGHTPGGLCFLLDKWLFTGDTLFYHTVGRTDLPFSDEYDLKVSLDKIVHLDEKLIVLPGHGKQSTILEEKYKNPHIAV